MEFENLKNIYLDISKLLECQDENNFPKIIKDNIPIDLLNRTLKIFDFDYGYFTDIKLGDYIINKTDVFNDIYGYDLFYNVNYIFTDAFCHHNYFNNLIDYDLDYVIDVNLDIFSDKCNSLKDKLLSYNVMDQINPKLSEDEINTLSKCIDNIKKIILSYFDVNNNQIIHEIKFLIKKSQNRINDLNDEIDKEVTHIHELENELKRYESMV